MTILKGQLTVKIKDCYERFPVLVTTKHSVHWFILEGETKGIYET